MNRWGGAWRGELCLRLHFRSVGGTPASSGSAVIPGPITFKQWDRQAWLSPLFRGSENSSD